MTGANQDPVPSSDALSDDERAQLEHDEEIITEGWVGFLKVGMALARIRDRRLYREHHGTFEDYVRDRWKISRTRAYELIQAAVITEQMSAIADTPPIENEAQARALAPVVKLMDLPLTDLDDYVALLASAVVEDEEFARLSRAAASRGARTTGCGRCFSGARQAKECATWRTLSAGRSRPLRGWSSTRCSTACRRRTGSATPAPAVPASTASAPGWIEKDVQS